MRIAIVAAHGVLPIARYTFQDRVASALKDRLNACPRSGYWTTSVVFPQIGRTSGAAVLEPTLVRVHRPNDDPDTPADDFFDVYEVYWSPFVRGKTNAVSVLCWLLRTALNPINTTARCREGPLKALFDAAFIASGLFIAASLFSLAVIAAASAYLRISALLVVAEAADALDHTPPVLRPGVVGSFAIGLLAAYLLGEALRALYAIVTNLRDLLAEPMQLFSRLLAVSALLGLSVAAFICCSRLLVRSAAHLYGPAVQLVLGVAAAQACIALVSRFFVNFFAPVQVYMTRDENDSLFAVREKVLQLFVDTLRAVIGTPRDGAPYDRVFVLAHSLGSTIALDAMLRLFDLRREGDVLEDEWKRIRGFLSFGTCLEKTKFFFEAMHPSLSQRFEQWRNDLYGTIFTADRRSLNPRTASNGIYWLNCWYFTDVIADAISSYRSFVLPDETATVANRLRAAIGGEARRLGRRVMGRLVAENRARFGKFLPWHPVTHEDYLSDKWFWFANGPTDIGILDVITAGLRWNLGAGGIPNEAAPPPPPLLPPAHETRFEIVRRIKWWSSRASRDVFH